MICPNPVRYTAVPLEEDDDIGTMVGLHESTNIAVIELFVDVRNICDVPVSSRGVTQNPSEMTLYSQFEEPTYMFPNSFMALLESVNEVGGTSATVEYETRNIPELLDYDAMRAPEFPDMPHLPPYQMIESFDNSGEFSVGLINAKNTMEIGVYTGYSLLATALALPDDGKILAMDINRENYELGLPVIQKAGVAHKIDFKEGPAMPVLDELVKDEKKHASFDFIFVGADKDNYINYHKRLIDLVKIGDLIGYDNTLWNGSVVAPPDASLMKYVRYYRDFVLELNKAFSVDPRIEICMLPIGDGITLCRRIK
ncbi:Caffeoyl-CoA O-methyltransferase [Hibiscus syriacus]|uniref:Caffeoyl-CoA O-methyltransferase n=1 Tax=Hibiscus syriacus TaxID=106335 RepID=A0A6A3C993_HIBSY|nr:Caffeoyl-CoA O-methyltransferase [Hibiscus syriacus]